MNDVSATNVPSIYAIGDVTNRINLTPVALMEGMAFARTVFGGAPTQPDYQFVASAVFCNPPLASVGECTWWQGLALWALVHICSRWCDAPPPPLTG